MGAKNEAVTRCDIHEVQVDAGLRDLSRQVSEHAGPILDLYNHHFALAAYAEVRKCQRVLGRFGVRNEDVQLDLIRSADAGRRREVDAGVADRGRDAGESPGFVLDLDDQIERNRRAPSAFYCSTTRRVTGRENRLRAVSALPCSSQPASSSGSETTISSSAGKVRRASSIACKGSESPTRDSTLSVGAASATWSARPAASVRASSSAFVSQSSREMPEAGATTSNSASSPTCARTDARRSAAGTEAVAITSNRRGTGLSLTTSWGAIAVPCPSRVRC